jgi:alpha-D-ribose 1-methylphosphonate 5-triphosphate synthase subunit PhnH
MKSCTLYETQALFRAVMNAMAAPGSLLMAPSPEPRNAMPLILKICDTLIDNEVTFSVLGEKVDETFIDTVAMITNAAYVDAARADFVIIPTRSSDRALVNISRGTLEYPEKSATVIWQVEDLTIPGGASVTLSGPGIESSVACTLDGLSREDLALIREINHEYPLGIDLIFCDDRHIVALPRTTRITFCEEN